MKAGGPRNESIGGSRRVEFVTFAFDSMLREIEHFAAEYPQYLSGVVKNNLHFYTNGNGAWMETPPHAIRHSKETIEEFVEYLLGVLVEKDAEEKAVDLTLFCPWDQPRPTGDEIFVRCTISDDLRRERNERYLDRVIDEIDGDLETDFLAWLDRTKQGMSVNIYHHKKLWDGMDRDIDERHESICIAADQIREETGE